MASFQITPKIHDFAFDGYGWSFRLCRGYSCNEQGCRRADDVVEGFPSFHCFLSSLDFGCCSRSVELSERLAARASARSERQFISSRS